MSELAINAISVMVPGEPVAWSRTLGSGRRRFTAPAIRRYKAMVAMVTQMTGKLLTGAVEIGGEHERK